MRFLNICILPLWRKPAAFQVLRLTTVFCLWVPGTWWGKQAKECSKSDQSLHHDQSKNTGLCLLLTFRKRLKQPWPDRSVSVTFTGRPWHPGALQLCFPLPWHRVTLCPHHTFMQCDTAPTPLHCPCYAVWLLPCHSQRLHMGKTETLAGFRGVPSQKRQVTESTGSHFPSMSPDSAHLPHTMESSWGAWGGRGGTRKHTAIRGDHQH